MSPRAKTRLLLVAAIAVVIGLLIWADVGRYLNFEYLKTHYHALQSLYHEHPAVFVLAYFVAYVIITGLSFPGAVIISLAGAAVFGFWVALIVISFASTIGATLAFLSSRFLLREWVQTRFAGKLEPINKGFEKEGAFYLFTLRLVPLFPFFMINLVMGLTPLRVRTYFWVSQLGMLPGTAVYINAGTQLGQLDSLQGIMSPAFLISFALLGVFPLIAKKAMVPLRARFGKANDER
ncbi:MAG: TVP38/TMEM64 family protein [Campylobacterales bacterium]